jgi:putative spermidine/putrescine transport system ATP-binding protein
MGASLHATGLIKRYGTATAVAGVDLEARPGEFVSLLGPSGCGKTTSLRMVAGLERPDSGSIAIDGRDVTALSAQHRGIGMVFQHYALFPNLSTYENIAFALRVRRRSKTEIARRVQELLALVHLEEAASRFPHQLSGGMQQRVALARALAMEPPLLLLDEPLSALDAAIRDELRTELRRLQRRLALTVLYVTHDQAEAMALSDRIVVMDKGRISQSGSPRQLYDRPETRFAATFVGTSNRRETVVTGTNGSVHIRWGTANLAVSGPDLPPIGTPVVAVWRPEAAQVLPSTEELGPNRLDGQIEILTFQGPLTRLEIRLPADGGVVVADLGSADAARFTPGQDVSVIVPPESIRLFP